MLKQKTEAHKPNSLALGSALERCLAFALNRSGLLQYVSYSLLPATEHKIYCKVLGYNFTLQMSVD